MCPSVLLSRMYSVGIVNAGQLCLDWFSLGGFQERVVLLMFGMCLLTGFSELR